MPLIASESSHRVPRSPGVRSAGERAQALRQACQLIASGRDPLHALKRLGLTYGGVWRLLREHDTTGELRELWHSAREWSAHYHADRALRDVDAPVTNVSAVMAATARAKARQWHASALNPQYSGKPVQAAPVSVVHHVVHLPDRGPAPDSRRLPAVGTLELASGLLERSIPDHAGVTMLPVVLP